MTQAFNLSQLANGVNTSGQLNAAANLYNQVPVANGGTGASTLASGAVVLGNGTSAVTTVPAATSGNLLTANGTAWVSQAASGTFPVFTVNIAPGTWTKPATVKGIVVTVIGGGGNGSAGSAPVPAQGSTGGGGGGTAIRYYPAASLPGPQPFTVGAAGTTSSFGVAPATVISATGGAAGVVGNSPSAPVQGGIGTNGNLNIGGTGASGVGSNQPGSAGGGSYMGGGGGGANSTAAPNNIGGAGLSYGGGGGGGRGPGAGGAGAAGVVIIEEFY